MLRSCAWLNSTGLVRAFAAVVLIGGTFWLVFNAVRQPSVRNRQYSAAAAALAMSGGGSGGGSEANVSLVFVTVPSKDVGQKIARSLVENKLAACVNIIPGLESVYFWEGKVQSDEELLLKIKTRKALLPELTTHVRQLHPYDECEVTAVDVTGGSDSYLQWVRDSTKEAAAPPSHHWGVVSVK